MRCPWSETSRGMPGLKASSCSQWVSSLGMWGEIWCVLWELCLCSQRVSSLGDFGVSCTLHPKAWDHLSCNLVGAPYRGTRMRPTFGVNHGYTCVHGLEKQLVAEGYPWPGRCLIREVSKPRTSLGPLWLGLIGGHS